MAKRESKPERQFDGEDVVAPFDRLPSPIIKALGDAGVSDNFLRMASGQDVEDRLARIYERIVEALQGADAKLTDDVLKDLVPGVVLELAVDLGVIDQPEPGPISLGVYFLVTEEFRDAFLEVLPIDLYRDEGSSYRDEGSSEIPSRNPREWIEYFKSLDPKGRWTDEEIAAHVKLDPQTIGRYKQGIQGHPSNLKSLAEFFVRAYPNEFADFHWSDLRWSRRKTPTKTPANK